MNNRFDRAVALDTLSELPCLPGPVSFSSEPIASFSFACLSTGISIGAQRRNIIEVSHLAPTHPVSFRHIGCLRMTIGKVRHIMALSLRECSNSVPVTCITRVTVLRFIRSNLERNILSIIFQNGLRRS